MKTPTEPSESRVSALADPPWVRRLLIAAALLFLTMFLLVPIGAVFSFAFRNGPRAYLEALCTPDTISALRLTLLTVAWSVPMNLVFGLAAAWLIAKFKFPGKSLLVTIIDLPFSVSPVVAGLVIVLLFGRQSWLGSRLLDHGVQVVFAMPAMVMATIFVTFPFVAREVLPLMQAQGNHEEEAALTLGAGPWTTFFRVSLPKVRWAVFYGVILSVARAMGEFGAVSVVSGHIRGTTNTLPLHAEILYNEYNFVGAFAVASLLTLLALSTLLVKTYVEWRTHP